jgi:hypothetical protein
LGWLGHSEGLHNSVPIELRTGTKNESDS